MLPTYLLVYDCDKVVRSDIDEINFFGVVVSFRK